MKSAFAAALLLAAPLAACGSGGGSQSDNAADRLEQAADQSTPEAANVLDNAADQLRSGNVADENAAVQGAMQAAGNAQAATAATPAPAVQAPPAVGAKPHRAGDPVPPPKLPAGKGQGGSAQPNGGRGYTGGTGG